MLKKIFVAVCISCLATPGNSVSSDDGAIEEEIEYVMSRIAALEAEESTTTKRGGKVSNHAVKLAAASRASFGNAEQSLRHPPPKYANLAAGRKTTDKAEKKQQKEKHKSPQMPKQRNRQRLQTMMKQYEQDWEKALAKAPQNHDATHADVVSSHRKKSHHFAERGGTHVELDEERNSPQLPNHRKEQQQLQAMMKQYKLRWDEAMPKQHVKVSEGDMSDDDLRQKFPHLYPALRHSSTLSKLPVEELASKHGLKQQQHVAKEAIKTHRKKDTKVHPKNDAKKVVQKDKKRGQHQETKKATSRRPEKIDVEENAASVANSAEPQKQSGWFSWIMR